MFTSQQIWRRIWRLTAVRGVVIYVTIPVVDAVILRDMKNQLRINIFYSLMNVNFKNVSKVMKSKMKKLIAAVIFTRPRKNILQIKIQNI